MTSSIQRLESLLNKKLALYKRLIGLLEAEKECLRNSDVDAIWRFSDEKQDISNKIDILRESILAVLTGRDIDHGMSGGPFKLNRIWPLLPPGERTAFRGLKSELNSTKAKVYALSKANKNFVEEYLSVLDEMISVITNAGNPRQVYESPHAGAERSRANLLLHREV